MASDSANGICNQTGRVFIISQNYSRNIALATNLLVLYLHGFQQTILDSSLDSSDFIDETYKDNDDIITDFNATPSLISIG